MATWIFESTVRFDGGPAIPLKSTDTIEIIVDIPTNHRKNIKELEPLKWIDENIDGVVYHWFGYRTHLRFENKHDREKFLFYYTLQSE